MTTAQEILSEIAELNTKMDKMRERHFEAYSLGSATRAKTTTFNANYNRNNDRLQFLKNELKSLSLKTA